jgi:putative hydrolase of the HAD superfamily
MPRRVGGSGTPTAIYFDAVGTLLHPEPSAPAVYHAVGQRLGSRLDLATVASRFRTAFCRQEEQDQADGLRTDEAREEARWRAIVAEVLDDVTDPETCFRELYMHFAQPQAWRCFSEAAETLQALHRRGYRLGLASNFDARLPPLVAALPGWPPLADVVVSSEVGWRKPAPEFFQALCTRAGLPADRILLVGDDLGNDYEGARAAGLQAILLDPAGTEPLPPSDCIAGLGKLLDLLP